MTNITLHQVSKSYGAAQIIKDLDLEIASEEFVVFVGPSGCGKSTLLRMIAGLETVSAGEIRIDGQVVNDVDVSKRGLAMVFQSYALYPHMTVRQNMGFSLRMAGASKDAIRQKVEATADVLQLQDLLERRPAALSGGQRQRVAIGRAIVRDPRAFLFDEPLSNLDAELRGEMRLELARLHRELASTMVYVTHDQVEAMTLADKIAVLRAGRVMQYGPPRQLFEDPDSQFVAGFLGSPRMNFLAAEVADTTSGLTQLRLSDGGALSLPADYPLASGAKVMLGLRPQHLVASDEGAFRMDVRAVEAIGTQTHAIGTFADIDNFTLSLPAEVALSIGARLAFSIPADHAYLFDAQTGTRIRALPQSTR